jgi:hypothetical protein
MRRITLSALALFVVGATSCVAYDDSGYQNPPGTPPDYSSQPDPYRSAPPPPPDYRAQDPYRQDPYDSRYGQSYPGGYDDPYRRSPSWEVGFFYEELSPYGEWVFTYDYGWAWFPRNVRAGWRPYYYGRWVPSDYGWMWVSYEPFGWATYHYGRWAWDARLGWIWVPGRTWGPAWVSWQYGQGYIGWAPLPPEVGFQIGFGLNIGGFSLSVGIRPDHYTFIGDRYFLENEPFQYAQPVVRNTTIIQNTTNITNYTYVDNRVINKGVDFERVERATGKRVRPLRVAETTSERSAKVSGDQVVIYKAPREKVETVQVDDSKPRKKGYGREREREVRGQMERREQRQPAGAPPAREPRAEEQRRAPRAQEAPTADLEVAPRARQESRAQDEAEVSRKQQKEEQDLRAYQRQEQQKLERAQREEKQNARAKAEADAVAKRHADEKRALEQEQKQAEQQMKAKQEVERKAIKAKAPGKETAAEKKAREEKEKGKKKPQAEEPPPPHR